MVGTEIKTDSKTCLACGDQLADPIGDLFGSLFDDSKNLFGTDL